MALPILARTLGPWKTKTASHRRTVTVGGVALAVLTIVLVIAQT